jgi:hypothetical protein
LFTYLPAGEDGTAGALHPMIIFAAIELGDSQQG